MHKTSTDNSRQAAEPPEVIIRQETVADRPAVYEVVRKAFLEAEHTDGDEPDLVERLRQSESFVPELSLVAEIEGDLVGHILFTEIKVGGETALALAPLSVLPAFQKRGVGGALIRAGHRIAADKGYGFSILLGHAGYYPRFGYRPAARFGILCPFDVPEENFMALNLRGDDTRIEGMVVYSPAFRI